MNSFGKYKGIAYLALLLIVLPLAVWSFALKGTVAKHREYRNESRKLETMRSQPATLRVTDAGEVHGAAPDLISGGKFLEETAPCVEKNRLAIEKYTPYVSHRGEGIAVLTAGVEVSGDFVSIVRLVDFIEKEIKPCRLVSLDFRSTKERRTGKVKLTAVMYIQQVMID